MGAAHRHGDNRLCSATTIGGATTVFANNKKLSLNGDKNNHGNGTLTASTGSVYANGKAVVMVGDKGAPDSANHPKTDAISGSSDVYVGD